MKDLLTLKDLTEKEIVSIIDLADQLKYEKKNKIKHKLLEGKTLGMIFEKSSTRTRVSFEVGIYDLGGSGLFLSPRDLQIGRGEPIEHTAKVLSRYLDGIMIRTFKQEDVEILAKNSDIPIINGLTDLYHPCQVLADLMTIREIKGKIKALKICYIGDGNNMAHSIAIGCAKLGMQVFIATPKGYEIDSDVEKYLKDYSNVNFTSDINLAVKDSDVVYTDVYTSMGQENETEQRKKDFKGFTVSSELLKSAKSDVIVLHCLPAHIGEEITQEIFDEHSKYIFEQAENRLHAQKAVMAILMGDKNEN